MLKYIVSDINRLYGGIGFVVFLKCLINPSFHAVFFIRVAQFSPRYTFWIWRNLLILKHGIDVGCGFEIGTGLMLPHPVGVVIGGGVKVGDNATIYQSVTLGRSKKGYPNIGNAVTIYASAVVVGDISIKDDCVIGALCFVCSDLEKGAVVKKSR